MKKKPKQWAVLAGFVGIQILYFFMAIAGVKNADVIWMAGLTTLALWCVYDMATEPKEEK